MSVLDRAFQVALTDGESSEDLATSAADLFHLSDRRDDFVCGLSLNRAVDLPRRRD